MYKILKWLTITATIGASFTVALLYASADIVTESQDPLPDSYCDEIAEVIYETVDEGYMNEQDADDIIQNCRDKFD